MKYLNELGRLSLGSRTKRFSDYLFSQVNSVYKQAGINFEAGCFPILALLDRYGSMTLSDAEQKLGTSHSYVSQKAKYLRKEGLISLETSVQDARSKNMHLTEKGMELIDQLRPCWKDMDIALAQILGNEEREIFHALSLLENKFMGEKSFSQHVFALPKTPSTNIWISDYKPEYKEVFSSLNLEWLEKAFVLQKFDREVFSDPEKYIIAKGGEIFFAMIGEKPVGTAALYPDDSDFELCKMSVDPSYRGYGIGEKLVQEGLERAVKKGASKLMLTSNSHKLAPAVKLYKKMGFKEVPLRNEDIEKYGQERINIRMEICLLERKTSHAA